MRSRSDKSGLTSTALRNLAITGLMFCLAGVPSVRAEKPPLGDTAPDFTLRSDGPYNLRLSEQKGYVLVTVFWSSWCRSCVEMLQGVEAMQSQFNDYGLKVWTITVDKDREDALDFHARYNLDLPVLFDEDYFVSERYDIAELPSLAVMDRDGRLRYLKDGYQPQDLKALEDLLLKLVKE